MQKMVKRPRFIAFLGSVGVLVLGLGLSPAGPNHVLYGADFVQNRLYTIDETTGQATAVGNLTFGTNSMSGIAFDSSGSLFGVDNGSMDLHLIDPMTSGSSLVGPTGVTSGEGALCFDPTSGVLYSRSGTNGLTATLIALDPGTGMSTTIGSMQLPNIESDPSGFAFLSNGTMLALDLQSNLPSRLLTIDKLTGQAQIVGPTGDTLLSSVGGLAVHPVTDVVYMSNNAELFTVDPGTGAATPVGSHVSSLAISGLSFGPPMGAVPALGIPYLVLAVLLFGAAGAALVGSGSGDLQRDRTDQL